MRKNDLLGRHRADAHCITLLPHALWITGRHIFEVFKKEKIATTFLGRQTSGEHQPMLSDISPKRSLDQDGPVHRALQRTGYDVSSFQTHLSKQATRWIDIGKLLGCMDIAEATQEELRNSAATGECTVCYDDG